ncbi:MAG: NAD-dependent epimerase/dehydratase family protein [Crocinitomicaceae bacterium]|nr:NAD-dependent epimerase/dehydratase family protein [Crocinitomicaceae bacterium]
MILVTGGTGLVGSHVLYELLKTERKVRAIYRDAEKINQVKLLFDYYSNDENHRFDSIEWVKADILDLVSLEDAFQGVEQVYHCAALVSFSRKDFKSLIQINRKGTANVVNFALKYAVKKFGYISSTAAIGGVEGKCVTEDVKWQMTDTTSGYAISKYNAEREVWRGCEEGMDVVIINPSIIFGAGKLDESSLTIFKTVKNGLKVYSLGSNAFVDARDVAHCFSRLMDGDTKNERFLLIGHNLKFKDSIATIANAFQLKPPMICPPKWIALLMGRVNELLYRLFNIKPTITIDSARSAYSNMVYSNEKIINTLNVSFYPFEETVKNVVDFDKKNR